ncbi:MAG: hypothetical protein KGV44_10805 [Flavobacteriaceae bacterium]|nr:hypothetical protein [Flavobacteriaceae bacterium]
MDKIELRSEKVRNIIGAIPPFIVRLGNVFLVLIIATLFLVAMIVEIPKSVEGVVVVKGDSLYLTEIDKIIDSKIPKGVEVKIFKEGKLFYNGFTQKAITEVSLKAKVINVEIPIKINKKVNNGAISFSVSDGVKFDCKIILPSSSLWNEILSH